jgi:hypothetical protein
MTSDAYPPPTRPSNEADPGQLGIATGEGDAYGQALRAMDRESGATVVAAGEYLVAFVQEEAEGMYGLDGGELVWHESPDDANAHLEIAVADAADGRFVPGLDVRLTLADGGRELLRTPMPFLWHPFLYHYGANVRVPGPGPYLVRAVIEAPTFMRHDPVNGRRYGARVQADFPDQSFTPGRKTSPDARPRGPVTPIVRA